MYHFQSMFDYLDNAVIKLCDMSTVGTDLGTVKQQIEELKVGKSHFSSLTLIITDTLLVGLVVVNEIKVYIARFSVKCY